MKRSARTGGGSPVTGHREDVSEQRGKVHNIAVDFTEQKMDGTIKKTGIQCGSNWL